MTFGHGLEPFHQTARKLTDRPKTQRISGEDGRHREGVETSTRTGETDQGVTVFAFFIKPFVIVIHFLGCLLEMFRFDIDAER